MNCQVWFKVMSMDTMFLLLILGAVALLALLILYVRGKVSVSFMTTGALLILFIFSFITSR